MSPAAPDPDAPLTQAPGAPLPFRLITLGGARIERVPTPGGDPPLGPGKPLALVAYLSCATKRTVRREEAVEVLWADRDPTRGRNSLRQAVWTVRQRLGEVVIGGDDDLVTLTDALRSDRDDLLAAVDRGDADAVVNLYGGTFLPALAVPGGLGFEQWADGERLRLQTAFLRAAETVVRTSLNGGDTVKAVAVARRIRDEDPSRESGWRLLLEALGAGGEWIGLSVELHALERMLREEGREPEPSTTDLLQRLRRTGGRTEEMEPRTLVPDLVGREAEFAALLASWTAARSGRATHVHLDGAAGMGKSRLLADLRQRLRGLGARVCLQRAHPGERELPWSFAGDLVAALAELPGMASVTPAALIDLVELAPGLAARFSAHAGGGATEDTTRRRGLALVALVNAVTEEAPLALLLDDLHWADDASRAALQVLLNRLDRQALLLVTASRPDHRPALGQPDRRLLALGTLPEGATLELLASLARLPDLPWAAAVSGWLHRASGGSPLAALEALAFAMARGSLSLEDGVWHTTAPERLERDLQSGGSGRSRLEALEPSRRELLLVLAAAGLPLRPAQLAGVLRRPLDEVELQLNALEREGLAQSGAGGWEPQHDRTRDLLLELAGPTVASTHRRLGAVFLDDANASPAALRRAAVHLRLGGDRTGLARATTIYVRLRRDRGEHRATTELIEELIGLEGDPALVAELLHLLPATLRLPRLRRSMLVFSSLIPLLILSAFLLQRPILVMVTAPISGGPLTPSPVVELRGITGRPVHDTGDTVRAEVLSGPGALIGTTIAPVVNGRASFGELDLTESGQYVLRFSSRGYRAVDSDTILVGLTPAGLPRLRILGGTLNGQPIIPSAPVLQLGRGVRLQGELELSYDSYWTAAAVFLCGGTSWGPVAESWWTVKPLATPATGTRRVIRLDLSGPPEPGTYYLVLALYADRSCDFIMSATNWNMERPAWNDGNDLVRLDPEQLRSTRTTGTVVIPQLRNHLELGPRALAPTAVGAAVLEIQVR